MAKKTIKSNISGMSYQECADTISRYLKREKGVEGQMKLSLGLGKRTRH